MINRKLRMGMIGGGKGAFIGAIHRAAALMDNCLSLGLNTVIAQVRPFGDALYRKFHWLPAGNISYRTTGYTLLTNR